MDCEAGSRKAGERREAERKQRGEKGVGGLGGRGGGDLALVHPSQGIDRLANETHIAPGGGRPAGAEERGRGGLHLDLLF